MPTNGSIDHDELLRQVMEMYRAVADHPDEQFHFETGRALAEPRVRHRVVRGGRARLQPR
jgi:hypothetical protein